jgi:hypothetical protein
MMVAGLVLIALGAIVLRHARRIPDQMMVRQRNLAHEQMLAAAEARRRRRE